MENKEYVVKIQYDTKEAVTNVDKLTYSILAAKRNQKELDEQFESGKLSQKDYAKATAENTMLIQKDTAERKKYINYLEAEASTMDKLRARNAVLLEQRKKLNTNTAEGKAKIKELTEEYEANSKALLDNGTTLEKNKANVGNYMGAINAGLDKMGGKFGPVVDGFVGMGKAAMAFVMNPIGIVIAAIAGVLIGLYKSLTSTEAGMAKVNKITSVFSGLFKGLMKVLEPVANFIADRIIVVFDALGNAAEKAIGLVADGLAFLGFDKASASVDKFNASINNAVNGAQALVDAQAELVKAQREANKVQLDFQKQAEKFRQIRDDESLSLEERIKANENLSKSLKDQLAAEMAIANMALNVANLKIKAEGETTEALDEKAAAMEKISDIQERITGQESEYLANVNSLRRDSAAKQLEIDTKKAADQQAIWDAQWEAEKKLLEDKAERTNQEAEWAKEQDAATLEASMALYDAKKKQRDKDAEDKKATDEKALADEKASQEARAQLLAGVYATMAQQTADFFSGEDKSWKAFSKMFVGSLIDQIQATIIAANVRILADSMAGPLSIATFGAAGVAKAAGMIAITTAAGAAAKAGLQRLDDGGQVKMGTFGGSYHSQGGNNLYDGSGNLIANVEKDENFYVMKRNASAHINALSRINESFGGNSFGGGRVAYAENGGQVGGAISAADVQQMINRTPIVVSVTDIMGGVNANLSAKSIGVI